VLGQAATPPTRWDYDKRRFRHILLIFTMTTQTLPLLTTRFQDDDSILARQWRLLKLLAFAPKGFTVKELTAISGVSEKTVRRDLALLKKVGFDVAETVEDFGRKSWRIRRLSEGNGQYDLIHDALQQIHDVALILGDLPLAESLNRLQEWVQGKCRKVKPR